jgi:anti-anti-sigma regulatory factor
MMRRIELAPLLRETVTTPYSDLVTRSTGAALRDRIEQTIDGLSYRTIQLDFTAVGVIDFSCADEVVAKLLLRAVEGEDRYVLLSGVSELHLEAIDHVLERHGLSVAAFPQGDGPPRVLGATNPDLAVAFQAVQRLGAGDAKRLADAVGWTVERAADALQSLALRRLIQAGGGTFRPLPIPMDS